VVPGNVKWEISVNVSYDVVDLNTEAALSDYDLVILPYQQNLSDDMAARLRGYVASGGTLVGTFLTGWADEFARMRTEPQPAPLADLFGILVQTHDPLDESRTNAVRLSGGAKSGTKAKALESTLWCDLVELRGAKAVGTYTKDFYAGSPAVTVNKVRKGQAWYVATQPGDALAAALVERLCREAGVPTSRLPLRVQLMTRTAADGCLVDYYLNHSGEQVSFKPVRAGRRLLGAGGKGRAVKLTLAPYSAEALIVEGK
jgi:beta-galactosidase